MKAPRRLSQCFLGRSLADLISKTVRAVPPFFLSPGVDIEPIPFFDRDDNTRGRHIGRIWISRQVPIRGDGLMTCTRRRFVVDGCPASIVMNLDHLAITLRAPKNRRDRTNLDNPTTRLHHDSAPCPKILRPIRAGPCSTAVFGPKRDLSFVYENCRGVTRLFSFKGRR